MGFSDFFSGACSFVGNAFNAFCNGVSLVLDSFSGVAKAIGEGIKGICDAIGTEGIMLIGSIAFALIIPGFDIFEIISLIQVVGKIAQMLNVGGEDSPEELGMKSEIAEKKPDEFASTEEYINYLNTKVKLEPDAIDKLTDVERAKYGLIGSALDIKAIQEKYNIELSPDFLRDVTIMKIPDEEVGKYVKDFSEKGITKMQEMTDYLREKPIDNDKRIISSSILETMSSLYPELNNEQLQDKLCGMENDLRIRSI